MPQILHLANTLAQLIAMSDISEREPWYSTDYGRYGMGPIDTDNYNFTPRAKSITIGTVSAADAVEAPLACDATVNRGYINATAGAGAFTYICVLPISGLDGVDDVSQLAPLANDFVELKIDLAASANPRIQVRNATDVGTLLLDLQGDADAARSYFARFIFSSGAWILWEFHVIPAAT